MAEVKTGKYRHYKGKLYNVIGTAIHSETLEEFVVYQALYKDKKFGDKAIWVRPKGMFLGKVIVNGEKVARFTHISK